MVYYNLKKWMKISFINISPLNSDPYFLNLIMFVYLIQSPSKVFY